MPSMQGLLNSNRIPPGGEVILCLAPLRRPQTAAGYSAGKGGGGGTPMNFVSLI